MACFQKYSSILWLSYPTNPKLLVVDSLHQAELYHQQHFCTLWNNMIYRTYQLERKFIYKYDCDCVPFYENQLGVLQACDNLGDLWGLPKSPESPTNPSPFCTPTADPSPTLSPDSSEQSPSLFSNLKSNNLWINFDSPTDTNDLLKNLSGDNFETPTTYNGIEEQEDTPTKNFSLTPENTENPPVDNAPKKRKISAMRELFDNSK